MLRNNEQRRRNVKLVQDQYDACKCSISNIMCAYRYRTTNTAWDQRARFRALPAGQVAIPFSSHLTIRKYKVIRQRCGVCRDVVDF